MLALARQLLLACANLGPLCVNLPQLRMQAVKKARDVLGLRAHPLPRLGDDLRIQPELLRDVNAGRGAWYSDAQLERGSECVLVEADGRVEHARRVCRVDLESSVMRGDDADACGAPEVVGSGDGQRGAFLGI